MRASRIINTRSIPCSGRVRRGQDKLLLCRSLGRKARGSLRDCCLVEAHAAIGKRLTKYILLEGRQQFKMQGCGEGSFRKVAVVAEAGIRSALDRQGCDRCVPLISLKINI